MIKSKRTLLIESLYKNEVEEYKYEIYVGSTGQEHVRTWAILNDGFGTKIKIEDLGIYSEDLIEDLEKNGYKPFKEEESKLKLQKAA